MGREQDFTTLIAARWFASVCLAVCVQILVSLPALAEGATDLATLREHALALVNASRARNGLPPLELVGPLNASAQDHADDMLARGYFAHQSPEGQTMHDRYVARGGGRRELVAENIGICESCRLGVARLEAMHDGWMRSPNHRENILREGLSGFGFGIASGAGNVYAVQTFAGPGRADDLSNRGNAAAISSSAGVGQFLDAVNARRRLEGVPPVQATAALSAAAQRLLSAAPAGQTASPGNGIFDTLAPDERAAWRSLSMTSASCRGCGSEATAADIHHFSQRWLGAPEYREAILAPEITHLGFALSASGDGRKNAVAVFGQRR